MFLKSEKNEKSVFSNTETHNITALVSKKMVMPYKHYKIERENNQTQGASLVLHVPVMRRCKNKVLQYIVSVPCTTLINKHSLHTLVDIANRSTAQLVQSIEKRAFRKCCRRERLTQRRSASCAYYC